MPAFVPPFQRFTPRHLFRRVGAEDVNEPLSYNDVLDKVDRLLAAPEETTGNNINVLTAPPALAQSVTVAPSVTPPLRDVSIDITNVDIDVTAVDNSGGVKIVDLPSRNIVILGAQLTGTVTKTLALAGTTPLLAVGTAAASAATLADAASNVIAPVTLGAANTLELTLNFVDKTTPAPVYVEDTVEGLFVNVGLTLLTDGLLTLDAVVLRLIFLDLDALNG
jgi:hypothetical protein